MKISSRAPFLFTPFIVAGFMTGTLCVKGADFLWDGSENDNNWANAANWFGNATPSGTNIRINVGAANATNISWAQRLIYTEAQGTTDIGGSGVRGLFIGNGNGTVGNMEITGGILNNIGNSGDGMANGGGSATLVLNGGEYRKANTNDEGGTFYLNYGAGTSVLEINSGTFSVGRLNLQGDNSPTVATTGEIRLNGGNLSIGRLIKSNSTSTHNIYLNGGTINSLAAGVTWADLTNVTWTLQSNSTFNINHTVTFEESLSGAGGINKTGTGEFTLAGTNTYTGVTNVSGNGGLVLTNNSSLGASGAGNGTVVESGARIVLGNGVNISGESLSLTGNGSGGSFGALRAAANATATWSGEITTTGSEARLGAHLGGNLIVAGNIDATQREVIIRTEGNDATPLADFDNTIVTLQGTYSGAQLTVYHGVVKLGASDRISDSAVVVLGTGASSALRQRLDLNGFNESVNRVTVGGSAASSTHEITNSAVTHSTLTLTPSATTTYSGIVTGNLSITKAGNQSMSYSGINTYTGNTNVYAGTFNVTTEGAYNGGGNTLVASGATFGMAGTYLFNIGADGVNNSISGAGTLNLTGIFNINLASAALSDGNSWQLVDGSGSKNWTGLRVTSTAGDFTRDAGIWTRLDGNNTWTFTESTGVLELAVIPEPGHAVLMLVGLAGCGLRRRRTA